MTDRPPAPATSWGRAAAAAAAVFAIVFLVGELLALLQLAASPGGASALGFLRAGALAFYAFHRVPIVVELEGPDVPPAMDSPFAAPIEVSVSVTLALMTGAALAGWLLFVAGRRLGERSADRGWLRGLRGLQLAACYAVLAFGVAFVAGAPTGGAQPGFPSVPGSVRPSPLHALVWPFVIAAAFGGWGAVSGARREAFPGPWGARARAVLAGGWRMAWVGVVLGSAGVLVVAALHPQAVRAVFEFAGRQGPAGAAVAVASLILLLPNAGTAALAAAMGASVDVEVLGASCAVLSYTRFPAGVEAGGAPSEEFLGPCSAVPLEFQPVAPAYLLFLLVPLVAGVVGGRRAARLGGAVAREERAALGAAAGAVFALLVAALASVARVAYVTSGAVPLAGTVALGPAVGPAFVLALVWGGGAGAGGGLLRPSEPGPPGTAPTRSTPWPG